MGSGFVSGGIGGIGSGEAAEGAAGAGIWWGRWTSRSSVTLTVVLLAARTRILNDDVYRRVRAP